MVCWKFILSFKSRPIWFNDLKNKASEIKDDQGVIYVGNPKILKEICPGVFGKYTCWILYDW